MPARSTAYQRVIYYIQRQPAPDAKVTESAMLTDRLTGHAREVDVLIEGTIAGRRMAIAIEVRDQQRRADVVWIESIYGKYQHLPVNQVVLISRSGFTATALEKARTYGFEALTPTQAVADGGPLAALKAEVWSALIKYREISEGAAWIDGQAQPLQVTAETALFTPQGDQATTVGAYTANGTVPEPEMLFGAANSELRLAATFEHLQMRNEATGEHIEPMLRTQPDDELHRIDRIRVVWEIDVSLEPVELEHGGLTGVPFAFGTVSTPDGERLVIVNPTDATVTPTTGEDVAGPMRTDDPAPG